MRDFLKKLHEISNDVPPPTGKVSRCHPCIMGKFQKKSFGSTFEKAEYPGEIVHSDLCGKQATSIDESKYFCNFVDQFSRFTHVAGIKSKNQTAELFESYKNISFVKKYFRNGVERLHTDGGTEYNLVNVDLHSVTTPHNPQPNPFSERINRTFMEPTRTILNEAELGAKYWEYALEHVAYLKNRTYHSSMNCTPYKKLTGKKPSLKHVRVFGCAEFVYKHETESKIHRKAEPAIRLECDDYGRYIVELIRERKVINSVHVSFDEDTFPATEFLESSSSDGVG